MNKELLEILHSYKHQIHCSECEDDNHSDKIKTLTKLDAYYLNEFMDLINQEYELAITDLELEEYQTKVDPVVISKPKLIQAAKVKFGRDENE